MLGLRRFSGAQTRDVFKFLVGNVVQLLVQRGHKVSSLDSPLALGLVALVVFYERIDDDHIYKPIKGSCSTYERL